VARAVQRRAAREESVRESSDPHAMPSRDLLRELMSNGSLLLKRQLKLAQLESREQLSRQKTVSEMVGAGSIIGFAAVILFLVAGALGIGAALGDRFWAGALIVGGALLIAALIVGALGWKERVRQPLGRTRQQIDKEMTWARTQMT
jgi:hypothetical protein